MLPRIFSNDKRLEVFFADLDMKKNYLLALSGGSDSLFLFYLLKSRGVSFTAVHVDHGWREASYMEAEALRSLCDQENVPMILDRAPLEMKESKDLENTARQYRYRLFHSLCEQKRLSGIFVAHHADDQAETVLKRVLEGAHLSNLRGMSQRMEYQGVPILRPLLHIPKSLLMHWLDTHKIAYVCDETNADERYLRARMRKKLFPWIEEVFGKKIVPPLLSLSQESEELACYMQQQAQPFLAKVHREDVAVSLEFPQELLGQIFLAKWVLKSFIGQTGVVVSRHFLQTIYDHLVSGSYVCMRLRDKKVVIKARVVMIE